MSFHNRISVRQRTGKNGCGHASRNNCKRVALLRQAVAVSIVRTGIRRTVNHSFDFFPERFGFLSRGSCVLFGFIVRSGEVRDTAWSVIDFFTGPVKQKALRLGEFCYFVGTFVSACKSSPFLGTELTPVVSQFRISSYQKKEKKTHNMNINIYVLFFDMFLSTQCCLD